MADSPKRCAARSLHGCAAAADAHYLLHPLFRVSRPNRWPACIFVPICHDGAIEPCAIIEQSQLFSAGCPVPRRSEVAKMLDAHKHKQQPILVRLIKVLGDSWLPIQPPFPRSGGFFPLPALRKLQSAQRWGQLRAYRPTRTAFRSPQRLLAGASLSRLEV